MLKCQMLKCSNAQIHQCSNAQPPNAKVPTPHPTTTCNLLVCCVSRYVNLSSKADAPFGVPLPTPKTKKEQRQRAKLLKQLAKQKQKQNRKQKQKQNNKNIKTSGGAPQSGDAISDSNPNHSDDALLIVVIVGALSFNEMQVSCWLLGRLKIGAVCAFESLSI